MYQAQGRADEVDKIHAFIDDIMNLYNCKSWDETFKSCLELVGFDWMREKAFDWDIVDVHSEELEMRSALEFLRPQLNPFQLGILEEWDRRYCLWRDEGFFFKRYQAAQGGRFTWQSQRDYAEKELGRKIPTSHWWYWPPDEEKKK